MKTVNDDVKEGDEIYTFVSDTPRNIFTDNNELQPYNFQICIEEAHSLVLNRTAIGFRTVM